jgi:hypothetical protein
VRGLTKHFLTGDDRQQIEDDRHAKQAERERDQHRVDRMPKQPRFALHGRGSYFGIEPFIAFFARRHPGYDYPATASPRCGPHKRFVM